MVTHNEDSDRTVPTFGRGVLLAAGALNLGLGLGIPIALSVMFLDWQGSFATSRAATAAVQSTCMGILFGGGVVAGYAINRFGPRVTFILGSFLASLGMFLGAFATNITFLLVSVGIMAGCGFCLIQMPCIPCCTRPFRTHQGVAIAAVTAGGSLSNLGLPYLYDFLITSYSWRGAFIIISGLSLNTLVLEMIMTSYVSSLQPKQPQQHPLSSPEAENLVADGNDFTSSNVPNNEVGYDDKRETLEDHKRQQDKVCLENFDFKEARQDRGIQTSDEEDQTKYTHTASISNVHSNNQDADNLKSDCVEYRDKSFNLGEADSTMPTINNSDGSQDTTSIVLQRSDLAPHVSVKDKDVCERFTSSDQSTSGRGTVSNSCDQTGYAKNVARSVDISFESGDIDVKLSHSRFPMARLRDSPWKFLLDPLTWPVLIYLGPALSGLFSPCLLMMDVAANKGFPKHGLLLLTVTGISSLVGKALVGVFSLCRNLSSFLILVTAGILGSGALCLLGSVTSLPATIATLTGLGVSLGVTISVYPKCFLDMPSVGVASYPLALGVASTTQGVSDCLLAVLVGYMVDVSGTYSLPFSILSGVAFLSSCFILIVFCWTRQKSTR